MAEIMRVSPEETREKVLSGKALLVCAYDDDDKFSRLHLDGAISLRRFKRREDSLSKDREIIFY